MFSTSQNEAEHILGKYVGSVWDSVSEADEWKHVINVTTDAALGRIISYIEVEYKDGDVCDDETVTEAAIVAVDPMHLRPRFDEGENAKSDSINDQPASLGNVVSRSATVRYYCGDQYGLQISEDRTCHYVVSVTVPTLCKHPLFQVPVAKKQVVKCLPVPEADAESL
jgi:hypothetical protein